jgi:Tannase and feruloyl esterase
MMRVCSTTAAAAGLFWCAAASPLAQSSTRTSETAAPQQQCSALQGMTIPRASIGLPSKDGVVVSASFVTAADAGNSNGDFCKVLGSIHPVDPTAPDIKFEVNLPSMWNKKMIQLGGGGFDGSLVTGLGGVANQVASSPNPLAQGYVTLGSDSGHQGTGFDAAFALNDEALANFGYLQIKKTHDAAMYLVKARYGSLPEHSYFAGGSQGGHEGFIAAQKYPADFDGVIAQYPAYDITLMHLGSNYFAKALYANHGAAWISPNKVKTLVNAVYAACDGLDGIADGIISNVAGCNKAFTIQTVRGTLRCADGADTGDNCLSDPQTGAVQAIDSPFSISVPTAGGLTTYPKWPILEGATFLSNTLGNTAIPSLPPAAGDAFQYKPADATIRYIITRNLTLDTLTFDPTPWAARIVEVSAILDANSVDLTQFMSRGGKLILMVGAIDDSITPYNTLDYYKRLVSRFGQALDSFVRFYYIPGFGHGNGVFNAKFDSLGALDAWVTHALAPGTLVGADANPTNRGRTRPLCVYPAWPKYAGAGDVNAASSFTCVN